jgi:hypothetical protein
MPPAISAGAPSCPDFVESRAIRARARAVLDLGGADPRQDPRQRQRQRQRQKRRGDAVNAHAWREQGPNEPKSETALFI